jgi:opacity protein-like surface antigen
MRGTGVYSYLGENAYGNSTGYNTQFDREVEYSMAGELGLAIQMGADISLRLGVEGFRAQEVRTRGSLTSNSSAFIDIESSVLAFSPMATIEYRFMGEGHFRIYGFGGIGYSAVSVTNEKTLNNAAEAYYAHGTNPNPYKESWDADPVVTYALGTGVEFFAFDNVTFCLDGGWRFLSVKKFEYEEDVAAVRGGATKNFLKGDVVRDDANERIGLNLGGPFVGLTFKFYIPQLY